MKRAKQRKWRDFSVMAWWSRPMWRRRGWETSLTEEVLRTALMQCWASSEAPKFIRVSPATKVLIRELTVQYHGAEVTLRSP